MCDSTYTLMEACAMTEEVHADITITSTCETINVKKVLTYFLMEVRCAMGREKVCIMCHHSHQQQKNNNKQTQEGHKRDNGD